MLKSLRNAFVTGFILLLPLGFTFIVVNFLLTTVGTPASRIFFFFLDPELRQSPWINTLLDITSTLVVIVLITLIGWVSSYFLGRLIVTLSEKLFTKLPLIGKIYNTAKQVVDAFGKEKKAIFQKTVLFEFPKKGMYAIGFLTSSTKGEVHYHTQEDLVNIFMPTTPNPTTGFLLMIPRKDIIELKMSTTEGMKLIISGGAVMPSDFTPPQVPPNSEKQT
ncbi:MAG: hypothetical protein C5B43_01990 [Verrucomicrobia bacterium]|nr:MAG: hypothetical protein C5B43_01990 [Verrucomicrobiota bacterium]